jgi:ABC-type transport system involved in multi-copper enzyme maturation permease subunit
MNWLVWKQHSKQFMIAAILLALFAALLIPTGLHYWQVYQHALSTCSQSNTCDELKVELFQSSIDQALFQLEPFAILILPIVLGLFWGVPLLAREYTEGTNLLVWTRSISRRRWLTTKLIWILVATAAISGAFTALSTWWSKTPNALNLDRFVDLPFSAQGIVPVAYAIFAVALGTALGAWFKRTMIALGVTLVLLVGIIIIVVPKLVRPQYVAPITVTSSMDFDALRSKLPSGAWRLSTGIIDKNGNTFDHLDFPSWPPQCQTIAQQTQQTPTAGPKTAGSATVDSCLTAAGYRQIARYQPDNRYWEFQQIEFGLYMLLSLIPIGATYWLVLRRDA